VQSALRAIVFSERKALSAGDEVDVVMKCHTVAKGKLEALLAG
jgi:hypothetical protein